LHKKGRKRHEMPCNHNLEAYLDAYIAATGIAEDRKGYLFRTARGRAKSLTTNPLAQADVYRLICRRAFAAGIKAGMGNHALRATGITQYLRNGGRRELAQQMAAHESPRPTALYDRRIDEGERILI
jgi:integrase